MAKLSKREKVLIYFAVLLAIFCLGYYLLLVPLSAAYKEAKASYFDAVSRQDNKNTLLQAEASYYGVFEKGKEYYLSHQGDFRDKIDTVSLEQLVLYYMDQYEIEPVSMRTVKEKAVEDSQFLLKTSINVSAAGAWDHFFELLEEMEKEEGIYISSFQMDFLSDKGIYNIEFTADYYMADEQPISWEDIS